MKELEDFDWFPKVLRQFQTDFIGKVVILFDIYRPFINLLKSSNNLSDQMLDLCSGSGEPAFSIFIDSSVFKQLTLSDKYPGATLNYSSKTTYLPESTDALNIQFQSTKTYTMFNAFHHFSDSEKLIIIHNMLQANAKGFFVEILEPGFLFMMKITLATTIGTLLFTPFIKPFSIKRLFFTYIIPINILTITYDGLVSVFKSRSVLQYQILFASMKEKVEIIKLRKGLSSLIIIKIN